MALGAAGPQRKSGLAPIFPLLAPPRLEWWGGGGAGSAARGGGRVAQTGEVTAGLNAEGNGPSLALGLPPRGFPTPRRAPRTVPASHFPSGCALVSSPVTDL